MLFIVKLAVGRKWMEYEQVECDLSGFVRVLLAWRVVIQVAIADWKLNCHRSLLACWQIQNLLFTCDNGEDWYPYLFWSTGHIPQSRGRHHFPWGCRSLPPTITGTLLSVCNRFSNADWCLTLYTFCKPRPPHSRFLNWDKSKNNACNSACSNLAAIFVVCGFISRSS